MAWAKTVKAFALRQFSESLCSGSLKGQQWVAVHGAEGAPALGLPLHLFSEELAWAAARNTLWLISRFEMANWILKVEEGKNFFIGLLNLRQRSFLFFFFLNQKPCLWQLSSPGPELNISIFREKHRTKFSLPRWINGTSFDSQSPIFPLKSHPFSLLHRESMLNFV